MRNSSSSKSDSDIIFTQEICVTRKIPYLKASETHKMKLRTVDADIRLRPVYQLVFISSRDRSFLFFAFLK